MNFLLKFAVVLFCSAGSVVSTFAQTPLVNHGDSWRYHKGTNAPQAGWKVIADANLDATWGFGTGGFGYADNVPETNLCRTLLLDMKGTAATNYTTVYMRKQFTIASAVDTNLHLFLSMDFDDGFIAWLDGGFLTSQNVTGAPTDPTHTAVASGLHESSRGSTTGTPPAAPALTTDLGIVGERLGIGTHTLAIIGLNESAGSSDCIQIADLFTGAPPVPVTNFWRQIDSPIVVPTNVIVGENVTLVIEPGVTVQFGSGVDLVVASGGRLLAEGNAANRLRFTRAPGATSWGGITLNGGAGTPETRITYANFESNGVTAIHSSRGTLVLDHVNFTATDHQYLSLDGSSFVVSDCHFPSATARFENVHGTAGIKSGGRGLFLRNFFGVANSVSGNYNDVLDFTGGNRPGPIIQFINNVFIGTDDDLVDLDSTDAWIEGNIFLHAHKNGSPDSASAVSGGADNADTSQITIIGNLIYDCDQAATAKQGNFYTLLNNTIVRQTIVGGTDTDGAVVNLADAGTVEGAGMYLEGNIIYDAEKLVRNLTAAVVTYTNNLMPLPWSGPGGGNSTSDPMLKHIPLLSETTNFTNWASAQIMRDWFSLLPGSPGIGTGPNGRDKGGVIPLGASISGEPSGTTTQTTATLTVGFARTGSGIPTPGWPNGSGFTHYKWRLDTNAWSAEAPIATPISLSGLAIGPHQVEVSGRRDSGFYQDDPVFGTDAAVTLSRAWTVAVSGPLLIENPERVGTNLVFTFTAQAGQTYSVFSRDAFDAAHPWTKLDDIAAQAGTGPYRYTNSPATPPARFYQIVTPAQP